MSFALLLILHMKISAEMHSVAEGLTLSLNSIDLSVNFCNHFYSLSVCFHQVFLVVVFLGWE